MANLTQVTGVIFGVNKVKTIFVRQQSTFFTKLSLILRSKPKVCKCNSQGSSFSKQNSAV